MSPVSFFFFSIRVCVGSSTRSVPVYECKVTFVSECDLRNFTTLFISQFESLTIICFILGIS